MSEEFDNGVFIGEHLHCCASEFDNKKPCNSSDALAIYEHEDGDSVWYDGFCYSCRQVFTKEEIHSSSVADELGIEKTSGVVKERKRFENKAPKKERITREQVKELWKRTSYEAGGYRGLTDEMLEFYGHRVEKNEKGEVVAIYYPETREGKIWGYKSRHMPKKFGLGNIGATGVQSDLSGQHKFPDGGKNVVIVGGETDVISAAIMFRENQVKNGFEVFNHYAVVSPTTGESSAAKQCRQQYEWFDKFDVITIMLDNDEVGRQAAESLAEVLPKHKVRIAYLSEKDPNEMLQKGRQRQFISDFFNAKEYVKSGIIGSNEIEDAIFEELDLEKISLPPFMSQLQSHMAGGIPLGYITNLISGTGQGKTTIANECVHHWIFNSPHKVGIVSLELDTGQYGMSLLSRHLGRKIQLFEDADEAREYLNLPHIVEKRKELWTNKDGDKRFYLLDDRDGDLNTLKKKIEQMILQYECKFIIIDPLQDALDGYSNEDQAVFMKWMKQTVKRYKVSFFNVNHVRKENNSGFDRFLKEDDIQGSSAIAKSAGCNIIFSRDKLAEGDIAKNVTKVFIPKCRWTGSTGDGGLWYYSLQQHTLYDMETYFKENPDKIPEGVTLEELIDNQKELHSREKKKVGKTSKPNNKEPDFMDDGVRL